jgi:hypothetical protein
VVELVRLVRHVLVEGLTDRAGGWRHVAVRRGGDHLAALVQVLRHVGVAGAQLRARAKLEGAARLVDGGGLVVDARLIEEGAGRRGGRLDGDRLERTASEDAALGERCAGAEGGAEHLLGGGDGEGRMLAPRGGHVAPRCDDASECGSSMRAAMTYSVPAALGKAPAMRRGVLPAASPYCGSSAVAASTASLRPAAVKGAVMRVWAKVRSRWAPTLTPPASTSTSTTSADRAAAACGGRWGHAGLDPARHVA